MAFCKKINFSLYIRNLETDYSLLKTIIKTIIILIINVLQRRQILLFIATI